MVDWYCRGEPASECLGALDSDVLGEDGALGNCACCHNKEWFFCMLIARTCL